MKDYKNSKPSKPISAEEIIIGGFFFVMVFGSWIILNLM